MAQHLRRLWSVFLAAGLVAMLAPGQAAAQEGAVELTPVDLELVLAVDVSQSVDRYEAILQRRGYIEAMADPRIARAIAGGLHGRIAVAFVEWSGPGLRRTIIDWQLIDGQAGAEAFSERLATTPITRGIGTSISSAIMDGIRMLDTNLFHGERRVIDISGDGPNSSGGNVALARDFALSAGIVINGVAINNFDGSLFSLPDLDVYYRDCVIGGPASFVVPADGFESFSEAILQKMVLEIASAEPPPGPVIAPRADAEIQFAQGAVPPRGKYGPACDIGERMRGLDNPAFALPP